MTSSHHVNVPSPPTATPPLAGDDSEDVHLGKLAIRLANGVVVPMVLKSVLELGVVDLLRDAGEGVMLSCSEIAERISSRNPDAPGLLDRMLRLLASYGVVKGAVRESVVGVPERVYGAGTICRFLGLKEEDGGEGSVAPLFLIHHDKVFMQSWFRLNEVVMEGGVPFEREYGMTAFEYPATDQRFNNVFNRAMSSHTTLALKKVLDAYKGFDDLMVLVDVGGGIGVALGIITTAHPHIKGINYDLPHVVANAPSYPGVEHVGGDMFESVPHGDAIFMKWILHDWRDENCNKLLKNCYEALPQGGKVIILESILPEAPDSDVDANIVFEQDLFMLAQNPGGKERTLKEYEDLATMAGFSGCQVKCRAYNSYVMEFLKT
ncbi:hypothetical protein MLD38_036428 [Melastoma candidum]|uniref:Uncharacterized protein n=1 Tax=Melastoma candidum TaxID=119954 RepID=A0ACB9LJV3_9MYRT|nr:hypothetical protein MLD38_036428 [Melastoma candidum]